LDIEKKRKAPARGFFFLCALAGSAEREEKRAKGKKRQSPGSISAGAFVCWERWCTDAGTRAVKDIVTA
jgi:hypothetical protein